MAIVIAGSSSYTPTGFQDVSGTGATIPLPTGVAIGDYVLAAVYYAQLTGGTPTIVTPAGWTIINTSYGNTSSRVLVMYGYKVNNAAALSALGTSFQAKAGASSTRVVANVHRLTGVDLSAAVSLGTFEFTSTAATSVTFNQPASGATKIFFLGTNNSQPSLPPVITSTGGTVVVTNRSVANTGATADSQLTTFIGGTGATYSVSTPNHMSYGLGFTPLAASIVKSTTPAGVYLSSMTTTITAPTLGNGLVAVVQHQLATGTITVTDNKGNTWTRRSASENAGAAAQSQTKIDIWDCLAPAITTAPTTVTVTTGTTNEIAMTVYEITGVNWQAAAATFNASTPTSGAPTITPAVGDLIITSLAYYNSGNANVATVASPYTTVVGSGVNSTRYDSAYLVATAATASTPVWTVPGSSFGGGFASSSYGLAASPASNAAPTAGFTKTTSALTVSVTSTATDSDGTIATTDYDWGDSTTHGNTANASHTYATAGTYTILQTVTDNGGATGTFSSSVTVTLPSTRPSIVGTPTTATQTVVASKNITIAKPTGVADGDWLIAVLRSQDSTATTDWTLAGWNRIGPAWVSASVAARIGGFYARYIPTASAETATSYTFAWTGGTGRAVGMMFRVQGADPTNLVDAYGTAYTSNPITNGTRLASYTVPDSNGLQLAFAANEQPSPNASETVSVTAGYNFVQSVFSSTGTSASRTTLELYQKNQDAGTTTQMDVTWAAVSSANIQSVTLKGINGSDVAPVAGFTNSVTSFTVSVTGTATDADGTVASYDYDWGDSTAHATTANATHTYSTTGIYTITQTVTDNSGVSSAFSATVSVPADSSPVPHFGTGDSTSATTATVTTLTAAKPANVVDQDLLVAFVYTQNTGATVTSVPSGWTLAVNLSTRGGGIYTKPVPVASAETATGYSWTVSATGRYIVNVFRVTSADLNNPIDVAGAQAAEVGTPATFSDTTITTNYVNSLLLGFNFWNNSSTTVTVVSPPSGMSAGDQLYAPNPNTSNTSGTFIAYQALTTVGATGARVFSYSPAPVNTAGLLLAIKKSTLNPHANYTSSSVGQTLSVDGSTSTGMSGATIASYDWNWGDSSTHDTTATATHVYAARGTYSVTLAVTDNNGLTGFQTKSIAITDDGYPGVWRDSGGVNHPGVLYYWDGTAKHGLTSTASYVFQPVTVSQFLSPAHSPWFSAHRGFSYSYPEETLYGYQGATDWGIKAIEVSAQMSADGTWWCFHDPTTDRTTGVTGTISSMTDAQIAALNNLGSTASANAGQPARPTAKFVDVVNKYYKTHVIIVEDKTYAHTTAMLNLLDSYGTAGRPANEIFIWKVASSSSKTNFFDPAAARGYHRWAYIFDGSMSTEFPALPASGKADMIGMDYASSDATLSSAIALCIANGVMPTGHIINSVTQRDRLLGLGMKGLMMSNKDAIPPWYNIWKN